MRSPFELLLSAGLLVGVQLLNAQSLSQPSANARVSSDTKQPSDVGRSPSVPPVALVHQQRAKYPSEARHAKVAGPVVLDVLIARNGDVQDVRVVSGDALLVPAAVDAVRKWTYQTYILSDQTLAVRTEVTLNFALDGKVSTLESPRSLQKVEDGGFPAPAERTVPQYTGEVFRVGREGVTAPRVLYSPEPRYSEEARREKLRGPVILTMVVTPAGQTSNIKVSKGLRQDIDSQVVAAVSQWQFNPATKNGKPVAVLISVQVDFQP